MIAVMLHIYSVGVSSWLHSAEWSDYKSVLMCLLPVYRPPLHYSLSEERAASGNVADHAVSLHH